MDKISTIRMMALLDEDKRSILEIIQIEKTFQEIKSNFNGLTNIQLQNKIDELKKIGLIKESKQFFKQEKNMLLKKFVRTF